MKNSLLILIILLSIEAPAQWVQISTIGNNELRAVKFFNEFTGIIVGQGGIWRSTNSGVNWIQVLNGQNINSLSFPDINNGFAVGDTGKIYRTFDNGQSWFAQISGITNNLYGVYFYTALTGHAVGQNGKILRTQTGGTNWYQNTNSLSEDLHAVYMTSTSAGYTVGGVSNELFASTPNGGTNWVYSLIQGGNSLKTLCQISGSIYEVAGTSGIIRRTTNSGGTWTFISSGTSHQLNAITFVDANTGYVCGNNGTLLYSTNSGLNWSNVSSSTGNSLKSINFINTNVGWIVGQNGIVLRAGIPVGLTQTGSNMPEIFKMSQNYPNPFNSETNFQFDLPKTGNLMLETVTIEGETINHFNYENLSPGTYRYRWNGSNLASGIYFIRGMFDNNILVVKILLIK